MEQAEVPVVFPAGEIVAQVRIDAVPVDVEGVGIGGIAPIALRNGLIHIIIDPVVGLPAGQLRIVPIGGGQIIGQLLQPLPGDQVQHPVFRLQGHNAIGAGGFEIFGPVRPHALHAPRGGLAAFAEMEALGKAKLRMGGAEQLPAAVLLERKGPELGVGAGIFTEGDGIPRGKPGVFHIQPQSVFPAGPQDQRALRSPDRLPGEGPVAEGQLPACRGKILARGILNGPAIAARQRDARDQKAIFRCKTAVNCAVFHQQGRQRPGVALLLLGQRGGRDGGHLSPGEAFPVGDLQAKACTIVCGGVPGEIRLGGIAQRPQQESHILIRRGGLSAAETVGADALGQPVCIGIAHIGSRPFGHIGKRQVPLSGHGLLLPA